MNSSGSESIMTSDIAGSTIDKVSLSYPSSESTPEGTRRTADYYAVPGFERGVKPVLGGGCNFSDSEYIDSSAFHSASGLMISGSSNGKFRQRF